MAVWERYQKSNTLSTAATHVTDELFHNQAASGQNFQSVDVVCVDGIVSVVTDTDDLVGIRLLVVDENLTVVDEDDPEPHLRSVYYSWFTARGPAFFRLLSKKTVPPEHKMYLQTWKALGSSSTVINVGLHLLWVVKH